MHPCVASQAPSIVSSSPAAASHAHPALNGWPLAGPGPALRQWSPHVHGHVAPRRLRRLPGRHWWASSDGQESETRAASGRPLAAASASKLSAWTMTLQAAWVPRDQPRFVHLDVITAYSAGASPSTPDDYVRTLGRQYPVGPDPDVAGGLGRDSPLPLHAAVGGQALLHGVSAQVQPLGAGALTTDMRQETGARRLRVARQGSVHLRAQRSGMHQLVAVRGNAIPPHESGCGNLNERKEVDDRSPSLIRYDALRSCPAADHG